MEKRVSERKQTRIPVRFPCLGNYCPGTIIDVSEKGMFIDTAICFPAGSPFEIIIPSRKEILKFPVRVSRTAKTGGTNKGMGVELSGLSREYLELLIKLHLWQ